MYDKRHISSLAIARMAVLFVRQQGTYGTGKNSSGTGCNKQKLRHLVYRSGHEDKLGLILNQTGKTNLRPGDSRGGRPSSTAQACRWQFTAKPVFRPQNKPCQRELRVLLRRY